MNRSGVGYKCAFQPCRRERLAALFTEIAELEVAFFDGAYGEA